MLHVQDIRSVRSSRGLEGCHQSETDRCLKRQWSFEPSETVASNPPLFLSRAGTRCCQAVTAGFQCVTIRREDVIVVKDTIDLLSKLQSDAPGAVSPSVSGHEVALMHGHVTIVR